MLVKYLTKIGYYHHMGEFAISFILMAFATSLPELFVAVSSALKGAPELAIGTALGSNIADLTLVIGIAVIAAGKIRVKSLIKKKDIVYMSGIIFILILLMMDGSLSRPDAMILLLIYAYYIYRLFTQKKQFESDRVEVTKKEYYKSIGGFIASIVGLVISAELLVSSIEKVAEIINVPLMLVGLVVVAIGTSLPELSFELTAIKEKKQDMVLGDIMGSVVTNAALILGVVAMINPVDNLDLGLINTSLIFLAIITLGVLFFVKNDGKLTIREAIALIVLYLIFISMEYLVKIVQI